MSVLDEYIGPAEIAALDTHDLCAAAARVRDGARRNPASYAGEVARLVEAFMLIGAALKEIPGGVEMLRLRIDMQRERRAA